MSFFYLLKMSYGKRKKWLHFRDPKFKNFLRRMPPEPPTFLSVHISSQSHATPLIIFTVTTVLHCTDQTKSIIFCVNRKHDANTMTA